MNIETYRLAVAAYLRDMALSDNFGLGECELLRAGLEYGVGPYDCACQICDDRADTAARNV